MNRNRRIFIVVFVAFTLLMIGLTIDMGRRTTAPWNKRREVERAFRRDSVAGDSLPVDSLLEP